MLNENSCNRKATASQGCSGSCLSYRRRVSEQARDLAIDVDVHILGGRMLRQARHRQDVARQRDDEAGAGADAELLDCDAETGRASDFRRIVRQRILRLGDADARMIFLMLLKPPCCNT